MGVIYIRLKSNFNKNEAYKILEELSNDNRPIEDGKPYTYSDLVKDLKSNFAFSSIESSEIREIIDYLISIDFLERLQNEVAGELQ